MMLLNWRLWAAIALCVAQAAFGWKMYVMGGSASANKLEALRSQYTSESLKAEQDARSKERGMHIANEKVTANYESLKSATAVAVGALDADRMRLQDALTASDPGANPSARACADDSARLRGILGQCANALQALAGIADRQENQLIGLQDYVAKVVKP